ncbi:uncharacterized protein LOC106374043 [Acetobacter orientalis]|uniref:Uncharacterized protein LOC106374043 n=1 Tax=Acetobacter orientalis TaxID=146474 RepID=A0A2Z5ZJR3_9PROT|nr:uncharacterized protein LOC106374043 [Acetobacter orientalis]
MDGVNLPLLIGSVSQKGGGSQNRLSPFFMHNRTLWPSKLLSRPKTTQPHSTQLMVLFL